MVPRGRKVVLAGTKTSRLEECELVEADAQVHQVLDHQQELLVVFCNGGVKTMTALQNAGKGGLVSVKGVLEEGERVVQCQIFQKGTATVLGLLVTDKDDKDIVLVTCRLVLDGDEDRSVVVEEREGVGPKLDLLAIHLGTNLNLFSLCKKESVLQKWVGGNWQRVIEVKLQKFQVESHKYCSGAWCGACSNHKSGVKSLGCDGQSRRGRIPSFGLFHSEMRCFLLVAVLFLQLHYNSEILGERKIQCSCGAIEA